MTMNEEQLVQQAQQDIRAFSILYDKYVERIYAYIQREIRDDATSQDILSSTFEKAMQNLPRYTWRGSSFGAWLYKIARNEIMMHYRRQKWTIPLFDRFLSPANVENTVAMQQQLTTIDLALAKLPLRDQEIIRLHYYEELSHTEIGEVLDCSTKNVAVRLHRAMKRLRKQMPKSSQEVVLHE